MPSAKNQSISINLYLLNNTLPINTTYKHTVSNEPVLLVSISYNNNLVMLISK